MTYYLYDDFGRYIGTSDVKTDRSTDVPPPVIDKTANWNGYEWIVVLGITGNPITSIDLPSPVLIEQSKKISPVEFKLLFTSDERVAIKSARQNDPVVDDFYTIVEDPRLTQVDLSLQSTQDAISYMTSVGLLTEERCNQILTGKLF